MSVSIAVKQKKRGRPAGRDYPVAVQLRLTEEQAAAIDAYRNERAGQLSRSEAIRLLMTAGLEQEAQPR